MVVAISGRTIRLVLAIVAVIWLAGRLEDLLIVVLLAILLATIANRPVGWLGRHGVPRPVGVLAVFAVLVAVLVGLVAMLVPVVNGELLALKQDLPDYASRLERLSSRLAPGGHPGAHPSFDAVATQLAQHLDGVVGRLTGVTLGAGRLLILAFATIVLAYFLAVEPAAGPRLLSRFAPPTYQDRVRVIAGTVEGRLGAWVWGQVLIAVVFGAALGLGLQLLGVPYAASLGAIAAVLELVPYVGGAITVLLATLAALPLGLPRVGGVIVLYLVLVNLEAHVLAPVFVGRLVGLPPVALLIALLVGAELFGVIGALVAVPTAIVLWAIVDELWPAPAAGGAEETDAGG